MLTGMLLIMIMDGDKVQMITKKLPYEQCQQYERVINSRNRPDLLADCLPVKTF